MPSQYHQNRYLVSGSPATSTNQSFVSGPASPVAISPPTAHERLFGSAASINSLHDSPQLSPVFKSEAAKQIIKEMTEKKSDSPRRRPVPKEKRRHYTVSSSKPILDLEDAFSKMVYFIPRSFPNFPFCFYLKLFFFFFLLLHFFTFVKRMEE